MRTSKWLALCAVVGPVLFILAGIALAPFNHGYTVYGEQINSYSLITQPVSSLGLGATAGYMNTAFLLSGLLLFVGIVASFYRISGLTPRARTWLTVLWMPAPVGLVIDGIFTIESFKLHFLGFLLAVGLLPITFVIVGLRLKRIPRWRCFGQGLIWASPLTLALIILQFATFDPNDVETGIGGLTERLLIVEALAWFVMFGWKAFREPDTTPRKSRTRAAVRQ